MFACYFDEDVTTIEPAPEYDPNGDGKFDMFDYVFIKSLCFKSELTEEEFAVADVNGDGKVNIFDYVVVKAAYFEV